jgi:phospholipid/cholesterol/gamma-HCH transport system substrate-binding protein
MRSRALREGMLGLFILGGGLLTAGLVMWLKGFNPATQSYRIVLKFPSVVGMQEGTPVRYLGVPIGRVVKIRSELDRVEVDVDISPADKRIPKDVRVEANQSGLIAAPGIDIVPKTENVPKTTMALDLKTTGQPRSSNCNRSLILCDKDTIEAKTGASVDEFVRTAIKFTELYSKPEFFETLNKLAKNSSDAAAEVTKLSKDFRILAKIAQQDIGTFTTTAQAAGDAARSASSAANAIQLTAGEVNSLLATNRTTITSTLDNIDQLTNNLKTTVASLNPVLNQVQQGQLLQNLETLSANAAQASANVRDLSTSLNSPANLAALQQTLDAARATFQNVQKLTSDLDSLTGDPQFRESIRRLVNGLSGLVSSTEQLQKQAQIAQVLEPIKLAKQVEAQQATPVEAEAKETKPAIAAPPAALPISSPGAPQDAEAE